MAVESVNKKRDSRSYSHGSAGQQGSETYVVLMASTADIESEIISVTSEQAGLPRIGDSFDSGSSNLRCFNRRIVRSSDRVHEVEVSYAASFPIFLNPLATGETGTPFTELPKVRWAPVKLREPIDRTTDAEPKPIVNTSNEPFDPPIQADRHLVGLTFERNEERFVASDVMAYTNVVNREIWNGFPPKVVKCEGISGELVQQDAYTFWVVSYEFLIDSKLKHQARVLNQGYREFTGVDKDGIPKFKEILDEDDNKITLPVMLDRASLVLTEGRRPYWLEFDIYEQASFSKLNIKL